MPAQALQERFPTGAFVTRLKVVTAVTGATERANHHPDVPLTRSAVDLTLISRDRWRTQPHSSRSARRSRRTQPRGGAVFAPPLCRIAMC